VSTPISSVVVYVPLEVVTEADFLEAVEEAQAQIDRISSPVNGLIKRGFLGSKVISPSSIESLDLVIVGTTMVNGQPEHFVEDDGLLSQ
jgi:hypothetical protein